MLRGVAVAIGGTLFTVVALVAVALLAVNLPWGRRLAVKELNATLAPSFKGHIVVESVARLGITGAGDVNAHVTAPDGTVVLVARGASARINPLGLVRSFLRHGDLRIEVFDIDVKSLEVNVDTDDAGVLKIQSAFDPAQPPPNPAPPPGRALDLEFPRVTLEHGWVHGQMKGAPPIDADLSEMHASIRVPASGLGIDVARLDLLTRGMPRGADAKARIEGHLAMPSTTGADLGVTGVFDGQVGGIPATVHGSMDGDRVEGVVDVPVIAVERIHALAPEVPLQQPGSFHAEAHGPLGALAVSAHAAAGPSRLDVDGDVVVTGSQSASLRIDARNVDLRVFSPTATASDVSANVKMQAHAGADGLFAGDYTVAVPPGVMADQAIPAIGLRGSFEQTKQGIRANLVSSVIALPKGLGVSGHAALEAAATVGFGEPSSLDATAKVALEGLDRPGAHADAAKLEGHASGALADPTLSATLEATNVRAAGYAYSHVTASVTGALARADVAALLVGDGNSSVKARATVGLAGPLAVDEAVIDLWRGPRALRAHIDHVGAAGGAIDVDGALITGVGEPTRATVHMRPGTLVVKADSNGLDLATLGYLLGEEKALRKGRVSFVVDGTAHPNGLSGTAVIDMDDACFATIDGLTGHIDTRMKGRSVRGAVDLRAAGLGAIHVDPMSIDLAGEEALDQASWRRASGDVKVDGNIDLSKVAALMPPNTTPFAGVSGQLKISGHVVRTGGSEAIPDVNVSLRTSGLRYETRGSPDVTNGHTVVVGEPKATYAGVDVALDLAATGTTNVGTIGLTLFDAHGKIVSLDASSQAIPYAELASGGASAQRLMRVPFTAKVAMPSRSFDQMPGMLRIESATGTADFTMTVDGTVLSPKVDIQGGLRNVQLSGIRHQPPFDAALTARYDGAAADATVKVRDVASKDAHDALLEAVAHVNAKIEDVLAQGVPAWDASASAKLDKFPLTAIPMLSDRRVHGTVTGQFDLTGLHRDARAKLDLGVADLRVGKKGYGQIKLAGGFDGKAATADLHFDQGTGMADAKAKMAARWGADVAPSPDPSGATEASLTARKFQIGFVAPFIQSAADALDGMVDADAHVALKPGQKPEMSGTVALNDGVVGLATLGQELHAVTAHVNFTPDGVVRLQDMSASATAGKVTAVGVARLDGTSLVGAEVDLQILKRDAMPLDVEGTDMGSVYGKFTVKATASADRSMTIAVDVPSLHVRLPDASEHSVEDLGDPPSNDYIGTYTGPGHFVALPMDGHQANPAAGNAPPGGTLTVNVHLGDAEIARGTDVRIDLGGNLTMKVEKKTTMTGQIAIRNGKLDVQGKSFDIESGTVTFTSDPANPDVKVTAGWTAEDGTRVLADYVGPLKTGKVTLRSEPARPQNEIVALIAFGTADGSESTPYQAAPADPGQTAGTTVGGFATGGLSKGLDKLTGLDITAKIDTSQANPRPEVEVQIARNISLELAVVLGTPPPGTNEDTTYATVDWRFHRNWSLETTFGNLGSTIADMVWRRRY